MARIAIITGAASGIGRALARAGVDIIAPSDMMDGRIGAIREALEGSGLVGNPVRLTLEDLQKLPQASNRVNHYCVEGWTAVETWTGVPFTDLARLVRADPQAQFVDFQSFDDDYHESWDIESAMHKQTVVAYGLDGKMLEPAHGAPARVYSPVKLGYKNTKYLTKIVFMPKMNGGYWSDQGYEWYGGV